MKGELAHAFNAMAEGLTRLEKLRQNMVTDVAHELRTPLSNVSGYLEALRDGVVMIADADNRLRRVPVTPSLAQGDIVVVSEGLPSGALRRLVRTRLERSALSCSTGWWMICRNWPLLRLDSCSWCANQSISRVWLKKLFCP